MREPADSSPAKTISRKRNCARTACEWPGAASGDTIVGSGVFKRFFSSSSRGTTEIVYSKPRKSAKNAKFLDVLAVYVYFMAF
jgi:hypothetical protein